MRVVPTQMMADWASQLSVVATYFQGNPGQTVASCVVATGLTAQQVYWSIEQLDLAAVPETDAEYMAHRGQGRGR